MALGGREATVIAGAAILLGALLALVLVVIVYRSQPEAPRRGIAGLNADVVQLIAAHLDEASLRSAHAASRELRDVRVQAGERRGASGWLRYTMRAPQPGSPA